jgi:hypothetical protein
MPKIKDHGFSKIYIAHNEFSDEFYKALSEVPFIIKSYCKKILTLKSFACHHVDLLQANFQSLVLNSQNALT